MSVYKLKGSATGDTENSVASLDVQFDGVITGALLCGFADIDADAEFAACEASFLSTNTLSSNDARGSIIAGYIRGSAGGTPATLLDTSVNTSIGGVTIPVTAGERIHMHCSGSTGVTGTYQVYLYVDDKANSDLRRRR